MDQEKIFTIDTIEKRVAELKFLERDLIKERDLGRLKSLKKAERSEFVNQAIKYFFVESVNVKRDDLVITSFPSGSEGRGDEEFLSEVRVEIRYKPSERNSDYNELSLSVYLNSGFQDDEIRKSEKSIMDRLIEIRKEVDVLKESKKLLKQNI